LFTSYFFSHSASCKLVENKPDFSEGTS